MERNVFKSKVIERDGHKCIICGMTDNLEVHHILDRSLFEDGGYHIDNGATLCPTHHFQAERTALSCDEIRFKTGILKPFLPDHFYDDENYDKWGNIILPSGSRIKGELFNTSQVQKVLKQANLLHIFVPYIKYPRTYHLPWSPNLQNDDRKHENVDFFRSKNIVVTQKMDGENTSLYRDKCHARSLDSKHHESRSIIKSLHAQIAHEIPEGWRICGENLYAKHSIYYSHLKSYFYVFSIWDENNICLSWEDTKAYADMLGLSVVPEIGSLKVIHVEELKTKLDKMWNNLISTSADDVEGYVIRNVASFSYKDFRREVAKYVRKNHVQTDKFWMTQPVVPNKLEDI